MATSTSRSWRSRSMSGQRERDLGHQHERAALERQCLPDGLGVHGGLAAGRVAVEQEDLVAAGLEGLADDGERGGLLRVELGAGRTAAARRRAAGGQRPAWHDPRLELDQAAPRQARDRRGPVPLPEARRGLGPAAGRPSSASSASSACWRSPEGGPGGRRPAASDAAASIPEAVMTAQRSCRGRPPDGRSRHSSRSRPSASSCRRVRRSVARLPARGQVIDRHARLSTVRHRGQ